MNSITLRASQSTIAYEDDGEGSIVILLHAFPLDSGMWEDQRRELARRYRAITPDLPGFGRSAVAVGLTIDSAADTVAELLDHLGVNERVVVGGLSMGGYVALAFSRLYPQRLRGLILADTRAGADDPVARDARNAMIQLVTTGGPKAVIDQLLPKVLAPETLADRPDVVDRICEIAGRQSVDGIVSAIQAMRGRPDAGAGLAHISVPTLVLVGEKDAVTPPEEARAMAASVPDVRVVVLPLCGHLSNLEDPAAFNAAVVQFLDGLPVEAHAARTV